MAGEKDRAIDGWMVGTGMVVNAVPMSLVDCGFDT
jgi:hypothetical protein